MSQDSWRSYEEVAAELLRRFRTHFALQDVEGKQTVSGQTTGTEWEIDAKGVREGDASIVIVECRRHTTSRLSQEAIAALAFRIQDIGGAGGIVVSPLGLQEGADLVAKATNISSVTLNPDATSDEYILKHLTGAFIGLADTISFSDSLTITVLRADDGTEVQKVTS